MTTIDLNERRPVKGYEGLYEVSRDAEIFSVKTGRKRKPARGNNGYLMVTLFRYKIVKTHLVHRVFADAWIPNPNSYPQVNHINGIRTDNRLENLEWADRSEQMLHAHRVLKAKFGFQKGHPRPEGAGEPPRPVRGTHKKTGEVREFESMREAARQVNGHQAHICEACQGKLKSSAGYRWEYID